MAGCEPVSHHPEVRGIGPKGASQDRAKALPLPYRPKDKGRQKRQNSPGQRVAEALDRQLKKNV